MEKQLAFYTEKLSMIKKHTFTFQHFSITYFTTLIMLLYYHVV